MESNYHQIRIIILGDASVGKSSLFTRYVDGTFSQRYSSTIGVDFRVKHTEFGGIIYKLLIFDTAGQEQFRSITKAYYHNASNVILMFDPTNVESFRNLSKWLADIEANMRPDPNILLVSAKSDIDVTEVDPVAIEKFVSQKNLPYMKVSAKQNINVVEAFQQIVQNSQKVTSDSTISVGAKATASKSSCCHRKKSQIVSE